jgi:uncharacterized membrane protein YjgN (DUF898 family)
MNDAQAPAATPAVAQAPTAGGTQVARMTFTGRGSEYFRIWVVNLFLSVSTLGIYSAWAKVRKTKYFWQNSRLEGHVFDFHGSPVAILKGRIVALLLLAAYTWGFQFSRAFGLATLALLLVGAPWLFVKAVQFKFGNTSYRGLRFGFAANYRDALRVVTPILVLWFSSSALTALVVSADSALYRGLLFIVLALASITTGALVPWMHHRLKAFQHGRAVYGDGAFDFERATGAFYRTYLKGLGLMVLAALIGFGTSVLVASVVRLEMESQSGDWIVFLITGIYTLAAYAMVWPYLAARLQHVLWSRTSFPDVKFDTDIKAWPLAKLIVKNIALTIASCGLYWPFAAIALAKYRVECMRIQADRPLAPVTAGIVARPTAVGDATADSFGLDLGL